MHLFLIEVISLSVDFNSFYSRFLGYLPLAVITKQRMDVNGRLWVTETTSNRLISANVLVHFWINFFSDRLRSDVCTSMLLPVFLNILF